ncbi:MAG: PTS transporter subunit EIIC [Vulcanimicrobiaceae bacterium]
MPVQAPVFRNRPRLARTIALARALADSPEAQAIRASLPPSFFVLAAALVVFLLIEPGDTFLERFARSFSPAFGAMSLALVVGLAWDLAARRRVPRVLAALVALAVFAISLPYAGGRDAVALLAATGSSGLFLAIISAFATVAALAAGRGRLGARAGFSLAALAIVGLASALALAGVSLTVALDRAIAPLGTLGDSLAALLAITLVETLLWTVGIHGPALLAAVVFPLYAHLQLQNTAALAHGAPLPHIVTVSLFLFVFPGGAGATLPLVLLLLRSRVRRMRRIGLAALPAALVNVNEPLMFGLPLVLNPVLGIPFVLVPLVLATISYEAVALGWVARPAYYIPSLVPFPINAFLATRDWRSLVLGIVDLAIGLAIYTPFFARYEAQELRRETPAETAA